MSKRLENWLAALKGKRIVVWGDLAVDHTVYGDTSRISREAPVLILEQEWETVTAGCAANAVLNVAALGGIPVPIGVVGRDETGTQLCQLCERQGIDTSHILRRPKVGTAVKMRVLAGGLHTVKQQVIRIDSGGDYGRVPDAQIRSALMSALKGADGVIVSDYGLGSVRPRLFASAVRPRGLVKVIDSRHALLDFAGADSATPNEPELEEVSGVMLGDDEEVLRKAARKVLKRARLGALLVTRGKRGMALFEPRKKPVDIPVARVQEIVDVTGAGDTVIATYTLALTAGAPFAEAARLANVAAGLAVMKRGAAAPAASEVATGLRDLEEA